MTKSNRFTLHMSVTSHFLLTVNVSNIREIHIKFIKALNKEGKDQESKRYHNLTDLEIG